MSKPKVTLLVDADIIAFKIASVNQTRTNWGPDEETGEDIVSVVVTDFDEVAKQVHEYLDELLVKTKADSYLICLSDDNYNWRKKVLPSYKLGRADTIRPELLYPLKDYLADNFPSYRKPTLEADDIMGILSTHPKLIPGIKIIVSEDKDMKTIPGWLFNPAKHTKPVLISEEAADLYHLEQTLTGDPTDGYKGCPGAGKDAFDSMVAQLQKYVPYEHTLKSGPRKGEVEIRWKKEPAESMWEALVSQYEYRGFTESDALVQARVARICRHTDYDFNKKEVILWNPQPAAQPQPS